jgi:hypothetical protein
MLYTLVDRPFAVVHAIAGLVHVVLRAGGLLSGGDGGIRMAVVYFLATALHAALPSVIGQARMASAGRVAHRALYVAALVAAGLPVVLHVWSFCSSVLVSCPVNQEHAVASVTSAEALACSPQTVAHCLLS